MSASNGYDSKYNDIYLCQNNECHGYQIEYDRGRKASTELYNSLPSRSISWTATNNGMTELDPVRTRALYPSYISFSL